MHPNPKFRVSELILDPIKFQIYHAKTETPVTDQRQDHKARDQAQDFENDQN